jgi:hypothetical protein
MYPRYRKDIVINRHNESIGLSPLSGKYRMDKCKTADFAGCTRSTGWIAPRRTKNEPFFCETVLSRSVVFWINAAALSEWQVSQSVARSAVNSEDVGFGLPVYDDRSVGELPVGNAAFRATKLFSPGSSSDRPHIFLIWFS